MSKAQVHRGLSNLQHTLLALLVCFFCLASLRAQFGSAQRLLVGPGERGHVQLVDFDGDGDPDVLSGSDQFWLWYENKDGEGTLSFPRTIKILPVLNDFQQRFPVYAADLDGDGDPDVVGASQPDGFKIVWLPNDGNGQFGPERILTPDSLSHSEQLSVVDIDADGDLDLLSVNRLANSPTQAQIIQYKNDGVGNFTISPTSSQIDVSDFLTVNLLGNALPDLVAIYFSNGDPRLSVSEQLPDGTFGVPQEIPIGDLTPRAIRADTIDNDTLPDLVLTFTDFTIGWLKNEGGGLFSNQGVIGQNIDFISDFQTADLDADGDQDVVASSTPDSLVWLENTPAGWSYHNIAALRPGSDSYKLKALAIGDLDQNGRPDILFNQANNGRGDNRWLPNTGEGSFTGPVSFPQADHPAVLAGEDLDNDGDQDLVVGESFSYRLYWVENGGGGLFDKQNQIALLPGAPGDVACTDLDADGWVDVVVSARLSGVLWYRNLGEGEFDTARYVNTQLLDPRGLFPADLNGDGAADMAIAGGLEHRVVWNANDGSGNFLPQVTLAENFRDARFVTAGDLDDDGDEDLLAIASDFNDHRLVWFENEGVGLFSGEQLIVGEYFLDECQPADLDADGDNDILLAYNNLFSDTLVWLENDGNGAFPDPDLTGSGNGDNLFVADFDLDGDPDAVMVAGNFGEIAGVRWYRNNGAGRLEFVAPPVDSVLSANRLHVADADEDGDTDIFSLYPDRNLVSWYPNIEIQPRISCIPFWDQNGDGVRDSAEIIMSAVRFSIHPLPLSGFSTQGGPFEISVIPGTYEISIQLDSCFALTTDSLTYVVEAGGDDIIELYFGLQSASDFKDVDITLVSGPTRCDQVVPFWLNVVNTGCRPDTGRFSLVIPSGASALTSLIETNPLPDEMVGDTLWWNYEHLFPKENTLVGLLFQLSGAENIGDTLRLNGGVYQNLPSGSDILTDSFFYESAITCAFDPNDKLVDPARIKVYDANLTLFEEELNYTIRFQNTGNDTAFTVIIRDTLSADLNWDSFRPGPASHAYRTTISAGGVVVFTFENILLPGSTTNGPASHGFVSFSIYAQGSLAENTVIENRAGIYFDQNPPILTNTVSSEMVRELPGVSSQTDFSDNDLWVEAFPNPFSDAIAFRVKGLSAGEEYEIRLFTPAGQPIGRVLLSPEGHGVHSGYGPGGMIFYQLLDRKSGEVVGGGKLIQIE